MISVAQKHAPKRGTVASTPGANSLFDPRLYLYKPERPARHTVRRKIFSPLTRQLIFRNPTTWLQTCIEII
jgi:hypothetical protein